MLSKEMSSHLKSARQKAAAAETPRIPQPENLDEFNLSPEEQAQRSKDLIPQARNRKKLLKTNVSLAGQPEESVGGLITDEEMKARELEKVNRLQQRENIGIAKINSMDAQELQNFITYATDKLNNDSLVLRNKQIQVIHKKWRNLAYARLGERAIHLFTQRINTAKKLPAIQRGDAIEAILYDITAVNSLWRKLLHDSNTSVAQGLKIEKMIADAEQLADAQNNT